MPTFPLAPQQIAADGGYGTVDGNAVQQQQSFRRTRLDDEQQDAGEHRQKQCESDEKRHRSNPLS